MVSMMISICNPCRTCRTDRARVSEALEKHPPLGVGSPRCTRHAGDTHPRAKEYLASFGKLWEESKQLNERERLVTWTDYPIAYQPIPHGTPGYPHLYFLFYRSPPRWNRPDVYRYYIPL